MTYIKNIDDISLGYNIVNYSKTILLIIPGGGYERLSNREAWPVAIRFNMKQYNTAVLYYTCGPCKAFKMFEDGKKAIKELAKDFDNIIVFGFSAGGHLAALLASVGKEYNVKASVLAYPVISLNEKTHEQTASNFLGDQNTLENRIKYSAQNMVNKDTVPCYIWTTKTDELVPYENTLMYIEKLKENNIYYECKIYDEGRHGLALADMTTVVENDMSYYNEEIAKWPELVEEFIKKIIK